MPPQRTKVSNKRSPEAMLLGKMLASVDIDSIIAKNKDEIEKLLAQNILSAIQGVDWYDLVCQSIENEDINNIIKVRFGEALRQAMFGNMAPLPQRRR